MRRAALLVLLALLVAVAIPASPGWAQTSQPTAAPAAVEVRADFNHDGADDLAIGAPFERVAGLVAAGAAHVLYGSASGLTGTGSQVWTQDSPGVPDTAESGDNFGVALASGDFDHDGFADLAVGAPLESVGGVTLAGAVSILPGSASGLTSVGGRLFTQVGGAPEPDDRRGFPLAAGDFNGNGVTDLAVSAPSEDVGSVVDAGTVSVLDGAAGGLTTTGGRLFTKYSSGIEGNASERDQFGRALTTGDTGYGADGEVGHPNGAAPPSGPSPIRRRRSGRGRPLVGSATAPSDHRRVLGWSTRLVPWPGCAGGSASAEGSHLVRQYRAHSVAGQALRMSHQRVHQIIDEAAEPTRRRWWREPPRLSGPLEPCSFCGRRPRDVCAKLIVGPRVFICDRCVVQATRLAAGPADAPMNQSREAHLAAWSLHSPEGA
jgi:hypothetical protein